MFDLRMVPVAEVPRPVAGRVMVWAGLDGMIYRQSASGVSAIGDGGVVVSATRVGVTGAAGDVEVLRLDVPNVLPEGSVVEGWGVLVTAVSNNANGLPVEVWLRVNDIDVVPIVRGAGGWSSPFVDGDARPMSFRVYTEQGKLAFIEGAFEWVGGAASNLGVSGALNLGQTMTYPLAQENPISSVSIVVRKTAALASTESVMTRAATIRVR